MALRRVGDYTITRELGRGGMGTVYEALSPQGAIVALKTVAWPETMDPRARWNAIERFQREARAARSLSHPNVCQVLDFGADEHTLFIVMEFLDGDTVRQLIDLAGKIELEHAMQIVRAVGEALAHAHDQGIIHRDVKPGNIMVLRDGRVKLTDFGVASVVREIGVTKTGDTVGTLLYMSPEQVRGGQADARSDIFALGATFYEMVTGTPAFDAESPGAVMHRILTRDPPLVRTLPAHVSSTLVKCLRKRPKQRFQSAREMITSLTMAEAQAALYPTPLLPKAKRDVGRWRSLARMPRVWRRLVLAAAAAVLVVGAVVLPLRGLRQRGQARGTQAAAPKPRFPPTLKPVPQGLVATYVYGGAGLVGGIAPAPDGTLLVTARSADPVPPGVYIARAGDDCDPTDAYTQPGKPFQTPGGIVRGADGRVLVADTEANTVWAIAGPGAPARVLTDKVPRPSDVVVAPAGFAGPNVSPGDALVCVSSSAGADGSGLYVIDHRTSAVHVLAGPPELQSGLAHAAFGPDGTLYAVEDDSNCDGFTILTISPDGRAAPIVSNFRPSVVPQPSTGPIAINPVTGQVFFACRSVVYRIPADGGSPERYAAGGQKITALEFSSDGSALFVGDVGEDVVAKIAPRPIEGKLLVTGYHETAPNGGGPGSEALCYVMSGGSDTSVQVPSGADLSPFGNEVAYVSENEYPGDKPWRKRCHIWKTDLRGNGRVNLTESIGARAINCCPLWSPDGRKIAFLHCDPVEGVEPCKTGLAIWVMNADGTGPHAVARPEVTAGLGSQSCPDLWWPSSGQGVLYRYGHKGQVVSVGVDGTNAQKLRIPSGNTSPDGSKIVDERTEPGVSDGEPGVWRQLYFANADGTHPRVLLQQFVRDRDIATHLDRVGVDRTKPRWQDDVREWIGPRRVKWSPKGDRVAFLAALPFRPTGKYYYFQVEVWTYELSTGILTRLTDNAECEDYLSWGGSNTYRKHS